MEAILNINTKDLLYSTQRDYTICNNFICNLDLTNIIKNICQILNDLEIQNYSINGSEITFQKIINNNNFFCTICIYKSCNKNKYLITIKTSKNITNFGRFFNYLKKNINKY